LNKAAASSPFGYRLLEEAELAKFVGGAKPFTAADTQASPIREPWLTWDGRVE
jgi:hypothetical protein